jgi:hypothetical protein
MEHSAHSKRNKGLKKAPTLCHVRAGVFPFGISFKFAAHGGHLHDKWHKAEDKFGKYPIIKFVKKAQGAKVHALPWQTNNRLMSTVTINIE